MSMSLPYVPNGASQETTTNAITIVITQPLPVNVVRTSSRARLRKELEQLGEPFQEGASGKLGRNDACWCGSGRKYKRCHMREDRS
ncbi:MAG: SEC-C metal-binding domain-containing protein [Persicimonas sp.]